MFSYLIMLILLCVGVATTLLFIPLVGGLMHESKMVGLNFKKNLIPIGMGICFIPSIIINSIIMSTFYFDYVVNLKIFVMLTGIFIMAFVGIIDDSLGNRSVTGLKGHFKSLFRGKLTTGGFKALMGGLIGLLVSIPFSKNVFEVILGGIIVALSTNLMNLLDLRPGRAIKVYFIVSIFVLVMASRVDKEIFMIVLPAIIAYFYYDLKAVYMMGDAGSNVLGVSIGIIFVMGFNITSQIIWAIFLIAIHIITEKYSLTKIIENNKFLNLVDRFGR